MGEQPNAKTRWLGLALLAVFLLLELALGARELGRGVAQLLTPAPEPPGLLRTLSLIYAYINAFGVVVGQPWPILLGGVVMGVLVLWRAFRTPDRYLRGRLLLAVVGYFAFTATLSYLGSSFPVVPNPGGTGLPALTLDTWASLLFFVLLALAFGRGSYCGVICPAATYWGGLGQAFISHNRTEATFGRTAAYLRSVFLGLLALSTLLSLTDSLRLTSVTIFGTDPAVFFSGVVWMVIWYLLLLAVPFWGNRAFTRLLCPMGSFLGWVSQFGAFAVRAKDPVLCRNCESRECESSCEVSLPVGNLLAARGALRHPGCVGCGNCRAACPHGNIGYENIWTLLRRRRSPGIASPRSC